MKKLNPQTIKKQSIYKRFKEFEENIAVFKLPEEDGSMSIAPKWEPDTYQYNFYETPEAAKQAIKTHETFVWLPRSVFEGRILMGTGIAPIKQLDRSEFKDVLAAALIREKETYLELIYVATRKGWKRQGLASLILVKAEDDFKKSLKIWEPTDAGKKFFEKRKSEEA